MTAKAVREYDAELELALTRLAAAERLAQGIEWLVGMVEEENFFDAWHQVRDVVAPSLKAYRASGQPDKHLSEPK